MPQTPPSWFIFEIEETEEYTKIPSLEGYFFVAAQDRHEAAVVAGQSSRHITWANGAQRLPAEFVALHAGEWPGRLSEQLVGEIEAKFPGTFEQRDGELRLARPIRDLQFNHHVFAKAALACLPVALLIAALRFAPADVASMIPARWTPFWLAILLVVAAFVVRIKIWNSDKRLPLWRIVRPALLLFAAGLVVLAWPELQALLQSSKPSKIPR